MVIDLSSSEWSSDDDEEPQQPPTLYGLPSLGAVYDEHGRITRLKVHNQKTNREIWVTKPNDLFRFSQGMLKLLDQGHFLTKKGMIYMPDGFTMVVSSVGNNTRCHLEPLTRSENDDGSLVLSCYMCFDDRSSGVRCIGCGNAVCSQCFMQCLWVNGCLQSCGVCRRGGLFYQSFGNMDLAQHQRQFFMRGNRQDALTTERLTDLVNTFAGVDN